MLGLIRGESRLYLKGSARNTKFIPAGIREVFLGLDFENVLLRLPEHKTE